MALEEKLLTAIQEQVIRQEAVEYVLDNFETEFLKALDNLGGELGAVAAPQRRTRARDREPHQFCSSRRMFTRIESGTCGP
jgi:hypothetical protein